jgi:hypothetical protein
MPCPAPVTKATFPVNGMGRVEKGFRGCLFLIDGLVANMNHPEFLG